MIIWENKLQKYKYNSVTLVEQLNLAESSGE